MSEFLYAETITQLPPPMPLPQPFLNEADEPGRTQYTSASLGFSTNEELAALNPYFNYQVYLGNEPQKAAQELDADPRSAIRSCAQVADSSLPEVFLRRNDTFLQPWVEFEEENGLTEIPFSEVMSPLVEDYMVESYKKQGFYNSQSNIPNHENGNGSSAQRIHLFIYSTDLIFNSIQRLPIRKPQIDL